MYTYKQWHSNFNEEKLTTVNLMKHLFCLPRQDSCFTPAQFTGRDVSY